MFNMYYLMILIHDGSQIWLQFKKSKFWNLFVASQQLNSKYSLGKIVRVVIREWGEVLRELNDRAKLLQHGLRHNSQFMHSRLCMHKSLLK